MFRAVPPGFPRIPLKLHESRIAFPALETARGLKDVVAIMAIHARHNKVELFPPAPSRTRYTTIKAAESALIRGSPQTPLASIKIGEPLQLLKASKWWQRFAAAASGLSRRMCGRFPLDLGRPPATSDFILLGTKDLCDSVVSHPRGL